MEAVSSFAGGDRSQLEEAMKEVFESLKAYRRLLDESQTIGYLIERTEQYQHLIPPHIFQRVREDYQKRKEDADNKLLEKKQSFMNDHQKHLTEKENLQVICKGITDRLKEVKFRYLLGEYSDEETEKESQDLRGQLLEHMQRLNWLDEIYDLGSIIGVEVVPTAEPYESASPRPQAVKQDVQEWELQDLDTEFSSLEQPEIPAAEDTKDEDELASLDSEAPADEEQPPDVGEAAAAFSSDDFGADQEVAETPPQETTGVSGQGYLSIVEGNRKGDQIPLISDDIMIGLSPGNDIQLDEPGVAGTHAQVVYKDRKYHIKNLDVLGRCYVNGVQTDFVELKDGDVIGIGKVNITVSL